MSRSCLAASVLVALLVASQHALADPIVSAEYLFTGGSLASSDADANAAATNVVPNKPYFGASSVSNNFYFRSTDGTNTVYSQTINDAYNLNRQASFEVTFTTPVNLTELSFTMGGNSGGRSFTGNLQVRSSLTLDNYTTSLGTFSFNVPSTGGSTTNTPSLCTIDLSALNGFTNVSGTVQFRFYAFFTNYSATPPGAASDAIRLDHVQLTSVVPEPASLILIAIGGLSMMTRRRATAA